MEKPMSMTGRFVAIALLSVLSIVAWAVTRITFAAERSGKPMPVRLGIVSRSTLDMPFFVARDRGFFREEGLEPELVLMRASLTPQALLGGSIDFGTATGTAVSAAVSGAEVRVVFAMSDTPSFDLIVNPSITSIQQLRGKKIGVAGIGGLTDILMRQLLIAYQIPPEQVTFLALGASDVTYISLKAGVIDGTMLQIPQTFMAQDDGFRKIASGADVYRVVQGGLTTTKATTSARADLVTKMIRATLRAMRLIKNDKRYALEFMKGPYLDLGKERERFIERAYEAAVSGYLLSGVVEEKLQREMINVAAQRLKPPPVVAPDRVFDFSFARKAGEALR
ncbi:MAG TPA: ABC transporter substrate-binding protein [Candidatus Binatia bacterium]|jgi:ABC-type nitrate/sulfonate/bicarbonate transport system substrate-binding protein